MGCVKANWTEVWGSLCFENVEEDKGMGKIHDYFRLGWVRGIDFMNLANKIITTLLK